MAVTANAKNSSLALEMVCDGDRWTDWQRTAMSQPLKLVQGYVLRELEHHDLGSGEPPVTAYHRRRYADEGASRAAAEPVDANAYWVGVDKSHINSEENAAVRSLAMTNIHELGHVLRARRFPWSTWGEYVATEGIATMLEDGMGERHFRARSVWLRRSQELGAIGMARLRERFLPIAEGGVSDTDYPRHYEHWFAFSGERPGYLLGYWCVQRLIEQGAGLPEIMQMPAGQIIGVE